MRIGIDCRIIGLKNAGIGRYVDRLVEGLLTKDTQNEYVLFTRDDEPFTHATACHLRGDESKCRLVPTKANHYSIKEQVLLPSLINTTKVDFMHYPNFNTPIFCSTPYVLTIHDMIKHFSRGRETTTRQSLLYWFKYVGYHVGFFLSVKKAKKIIVPTNAVKEQLVKYYSLDPQKVVVTYEGIDSSFVVDKVVDSNTVNGVLFQYKISSPYLLYVGSVYPHKNIERLIEAVKLIRQNNSTLLKLVVVCGRSIFWERLAKKITTMGALDYVNLVGFVPDEDLRILYNQANAYVFPTLSEGFGLPGLEAMAAGCPVICSDIPVLKEVYQNAAVYFDPMSIDDIANKIFSVISNADLRNSLIEKGNQCYPNYQWSKMVDQTIEIYREISLNLRSN